MPKPSDLFRGRRSRFEASAPANTKLGAAKRAAGNIDYCLGSRRLRGVIAWWPAMRFGAVLFAPTSNVCRSRRLEARSAIEKHRKIITGIRDAAPHFWDGIHRKAVENRFDTLSIDLSMNTCEVPKANRYHAPNPRRGVPGQSQTL